MPLKVAYLHTVSSLVGLFNELSKELLPSGTEVFHIADEMLLKTVMAQGGLSPFIYQRVADNVVAAERAGATVVQCTCSSISPCVEAVRPLVAIPVLKIDDPMVEKAISMGKKYRCSRHRPHHTQANHRTCTGQGGCPEHSSQGRLGVVRGCLCRPLLRGHGDP